MYDGLTVGIDNASLGDAFIYKPNSDVTFGLGPSSRLGRIFGAVAFGGNRLPVQLPTTQSNFSYSLEATAPLLRCEPATVEVQNQLVWLSNMTKIAGNYNMSYGSMKWDYDPKPLLTPSHGEIGYLGTLRQYDITNVSNTHNLTSTATNMYSNEFAFAIQRRPTEPGVPSDTDYISCWLWNASLSFTVTAVAGVPRIDNVEEKLLNKFDVSGNLTAGDPKLMSYAAYVWAMSDYLLGSIAWQKNQIRANVVAREPISTTYLSSGSQFYNMVANMDAMGNITSDLANPSTIRNISFSEDLEAFSLNVTLSLLNDPSLCNHVPVEVTSTSYLTVYIYRSKNLLLSYGLALLLSAISVGIGIYAFHMNGVSHDVRVSSIGAAMQDAEVKDALRQMQASTAQPLNKQAGHGIRLRFDPCKGFVLKPSDRDV